MANAKANVVTKLTADTSNFDLGMHRARNQMHRTAETSKKVNDQMRLMRGGFGQVGHQIQDVAVQLQMGQNAMLVFGQQGSQIASLFGPKGAMIGAVLAVGAAVSMSLAPRLFGATEAMKELKRESESLVDKFDELEGAARLQALAMAAEKQEDLEHAINKANKEIEFQQTVLRQQALSANVSEKAIKDASDEILTQQAIIEIAQEQLGVLAKKVDGVTTAFEKESESLDNQIAKFGLSAQALRDYEIQQMQATETEKEALLQKSQQLGILEKEQEAREKLAKEQEKENRAREQAQKKYDTLLQQQESQLSRQIETFGKSAQAIRDYTIKQLELNEADKESLLILSEKLGVKEKEEEANKKAQEAQEDRVKKLMKLQEEAQREQDRVVRQFSDSIGDGFVNAITGAENFADAMRGVAKSVVDSLLKMIIQKLIVDQIFGFVSGVMDQGATNREFGYGQALGSGDPFRAKGGPVQAGKPYIVGEQGVEMFVPNQSGMVIPNNKLGGSATVINQTINVSTGVQQTVRAEIATLMPQIANATKQAVADARMRGGSYSKALVGA